MSLSDLLQSINDSPLGTSIRESGVLFPWIESIHVLGMSIVVGSIVIVDLRLLGLPAHRKGARQLIVDMLPFTWAAFVMSAISGALLFTSAAPIYMANGPFLFKMGLMALAGVNMAVFHRSAYHNIDQWNETTPPVSARMAGLISLLLWIAIVALGRWIGFTRS